MAFPLKNDFVAGGPVNQFDADWHNTVSNILNYLSGVGVAIQKTPVPGQASPWKLIVDISNAFNGFLNATGSAIQTIGDANSAGGALTSSAARADHVHADKRARTSGYTVTDLSLGASPTPGTLNPYTTSWNVTNNTTGVKVSVLTRIRYSESDAAPAVPTLYFYYRTLTYDPCGRLLEVSAEGRVAFHIPIAVTIG